MRRFLIAVAMLFVMSPGDMTSAPAQTMDDLNLQVHGYATQGFLYSTQNNWNTTKSSDGSSAWTEAVVNLTSQPDPRLRIALQARYFLLGNYGNQITLDFASADYKFNERFGLRAGKVKSPTGLLNETQDFDPGQLWVLLPQSIYPIASRNSQLAHYGAVAYGTVQLGESLGKFDYRAFGGQRVLAPDDGSLQRYRDLGFAIPNGIAGPVFGATLRWNTPIEGLLIGLTTTSDGLFGKLTLKTPEGTQEGTNDLSHFKRTFFFAKYERNKVMFAGEYSRQALLTTFQFSGFPTTFPYDPRSYYLMGSYKVTSKFTTGLYFSSIVNHADPIGVERYQKDWAISGRHDFNPFLYAKVEEHFVDGTLIGYRILDNPAGLKPNSHMTLFKVGVSF